MRLRLLQLAAAASLAFVGGSSISLAQLSEPSTKATRDAAQDKLRALHLRAEDIKDELTRTGRVVRREAGEVGQTVADSTTDARITAAIKTKLVADRDLSTLNLSANTTAGVVTFTGTASSPEHISKAMLLAMETAGVREVVSTLSIQPGKRLLTDAEVGLAGTSSPKLSQVFSCLPGVTIRLPAGWKQIDRQTLDASASELIEEVPNAHLEKQTLAAGFQPESDQPGIIFPRIIVIANKVGRVSYQELKELVASLKQEMQRGADGAVKGNPWKAAIKVGDVSYDDQRHCLRVEGVVSAASGGTLRGIQAIFPTEFGLVTFQFSSTGQEYDRYAPLFSNIIDGIETSTVPRAQSPTTGASYGEGQDWVSSVILATLGGGAILVVVWQLWLYVAPASGQRSRANIELPPVTEGAPPGIPDATMQGSEATWAHGYFILQSEEAEGPYSIEELRSLWGAGSITRETFYCEEGYDEWLRLERVADQLQSASAEQTSVKETQTNLSPRMTQPPIPAAVASQKPKPLESAPPPPPQSREIASPTAVRTSAEQDSANLPPPLRPPPGPPIATQKILMLAKQTVLIFSAVAFLGCGLCPPWVYVMNNQGLHVESDAGYSPIFAPPSPQRHPDRLAEDWRSYAQLFSPKVDMSRLAVEWISVCALAGVVWFCVPKSKVVEGSSLSR